MGVSVDEFTSWCYRHGGETYGQEESAGVAYRFPDTGTPDRVTRISDTTFEVITEGPFYTARSLHQHADSWIDDDDRLHIDTDDTRLIIDPR
jgi:hypothetical protein